MLATGKSRRLTLEDLVITGMRGNAIRLVRGNGVDIGRCIVTGAGNHAIMAIRTANVRITDCTIYANDYSGIRLDRATAEVSFATLYANGTAGLRTHRTALTLRDSLVTDNGGAGLSVSGDAPVDVTYTYFFGNTKNLNPPEVPIGIGTSLGQDPMYVDTDGPDDVLGGTGWRDDDLSLRQVRGGQNETSPAVDAGSASVEALGVTGSTASNGVPDIGQVDLGAHQ